MSQTSLSPLTHFATVIIAAAVLLGVPFVAFANVDAIAAKATGVDTVSGATTIMDAPSGKYTILINRDKHPNADVLEDWVTFFSGEEAPLIMEDINCVALEGDTAGIDMAESLQSRLPENQMKLRIETAPLALSKADAGLFDALVMSDEAADMYDASTVANSQGVVVINR